MPLGCACRHHGLAQARQLRSVPFITHINLHTHPPILEHVLIQPNASVHLDMAAIESRTGVPPGQHPNAVPVEWAVLGRCHNPRYRRDGCLRPFVGLHCEVP